MAAESSGVHPHIVADRVVHVELGEPRRFDAPGPFRPILVTHVRITDGYADTDFGRVSSGSRAGRSVDLLGWDIRNNGTTGSRTAYYRFTAGSAVNRSLAEMPGWVVDVVASARRFVAEQSAGDR